MITFLTTILPFAIILFFVGMFFFVQKTAKKYLTIKLTHWLLFIYIGVLLLASTMVPFISVDTMGLARMDQVEIDNEIGNLHAKLSKGKISDIDSKYLLKESSFSDYVDQSLKIVSSGGTQVYVERMKNDDNKIEAFLYASKLIINGMLVPEEIKPYQLEINGHELTITPNFQELHVSIASSSFPIRQISGETIKHTSFSNGDQLIYLRIPKNLEITADEQVTIIEVAE